VGIARYVLVFGLTGCLLTSCRQHGCTDPDATNHNPKAKVSDNSCIYPPDHCTDVIDARDGAKYKAIKIGDLCWMTNNLNYESPSSWCYDDSAINCDSHGRLYRWDKARQICPDGWHLPSFSEWMELLDHFGGVDGAGSSLMQGGASGMEIMVSGMNQWSGPSQYQYEFKNLDVSGYYWTSSEHQAGTSAYAISFSKSSMTASVNVMQEAHGLSCRCVKD